MRAFAHVAEQHREDSPAVADRTAVPAAVLLHDVRPAGLRRSGAVALDLLVVAAAFALGFVVGPLLGALLAVATLLLVLADLARTGRSPGRRAAGLRTVDRRTALPALRAVLPGRGLTADLRRGRDPLLVVAAPALAPALPADPAQVPHDPWVASETSRHTGGVVVVTDEGATVTVLGTTIVGRSPVDTTGTHYLLGIPDISRSISRSHALLELDGPLLWVTDLGSANGSAVALPGGAFSPLTPYVRSPAPAGARIALGTRTLQVADPTRPEGAQ